MPEDQSPFIIFYTDDDADDREVFREIVTSLASGHELHLQENGDELLQALDNQPSPHLVFLDLNMPRKNGWDALKEMRASGQHQHTPVILFTTSSDPENVAKAKDLGADMFISKPRTYQQYRQTLQDVLARDWRNPLSKNFESRIN